MTEIVSFNGRFYTPEVLATMELQQLVDLHNRVVSLHNGAEVQAFVDLDDAVKETWNVLLGLGGDAQEGFSRPASEVEAGEPSDPSPYPPPSPARRAEPSKRLKRFKFPKTGKVSPPRAGTLRHRVLELLRAGATYEQVIECVKAFDADRQLDEKNVERRAYEVIRLLHFYNGYGMAHDGDEIKVVE